MTLHLWTDRLDIPVPMGAYVYPLPDIVDGRIDINLLMIAPSIGMTLTPSVSLSNTRYAGDIHINDARIIGIGQSNQSPGHGTHLTHHIDYVEITGPVDDLSLSVNLNGVDDPADVILGLAVGGNKNALDPRDDLKESAPDLTLPPISQMEYQEPDLRQRICCPACIAMVAGYHGAKNLGLDDIINTCYRPQVDLYGVWPQAVYAANQAGLSGYLHRFSNMGMAADLTQRGIPVICSLSYADGELTGAAIHETDGHLMVLAGIGADRVTVYDPAAKGADMVKRIYDRDEFMTAWFNHGGLGIIVI